MSTRAAIYTRSSKDRSDVSIHAQRRELQALATDQGLAIVEEFSDVVESAKDERRPGFQSLLRALRATDRTWSHLLVVDTSRLSRRQYMAQVFGHEARKRGVQIHYAKLPQSDPIADLVVVSVMQVFDELHSLMSREKGLAGMRENTLQGWRAGGRAPWGYRLRAVETGAVRDGQPVTKTVLELDPQTADTARAYFQRRVAGEPRAQVRSDLGIRRPASSLVDTEWQALTYAGALVWNQTRPRLADGGYEGGTKRRPRDEWVIQPDAHEALITREQAELLLSRLEAASARRPRRRASARLLTGLLVGAGMRWHSRGDGYYRHEGAGRSILATLVEEPVLGAVMTDLHRPGFARDLVAASRERRRDDGADTRPLRQELTALERSIERQMVLAEGLTDPGPALRRIDALEADRKSLTARIAELEAESANRRALTGVTERSVRRHLAELAARIAEAPADMVRTLLGSLIHSVELDPESRACTIAYLPAMAGDRMASPRGREPIPRSVTTEVAIRAPRRRAVAGSSKEPPHDEGT